MQHSVSRQQLNLIKRKQIKRKERERKLFRMVAAKHQGHMQGPTIVGNFLCFYL